jgi:hypothetical protein
MSLVRHGRAIRLVSCSWLMLLACGGISQRGGSDESSGGTAAGSTAVGGTASTPAAGGRPSNSHAGNSAAGKPTGTAGTATTMPTTPAGDAEPCFNDSDCPVNSCGGQVCNWNKSHERPTADKAFVCNPAGTDPQGQDGWCTTDADCKCRAQGAKCVGVYCTFTLASGAPGG